MLEKRRYAEAHFGLWAVVKAPLLISADLRHLDTMSLDVLTNEEVIAINQDALGVAGDLVYTHGMLQVRCTLLLCPPICAGPAWHASVHCGKCEAHNWQHSRVDLFLYCEQAVACLDGERTDFRQSGACAQACMCATAHVWRKQRD